MASNTNVSAFNDHDIENNNLEPKFQINYLPPQEDSVSKSPLGDIKSEEYAGYRFNFNIDSDN